MAAAGLKPKASLACPCGLGSDYAQCCALLHLGANAPHPEALMRARYSAYAMKNSAYVLRTWLPQTCPAEPVIDTAITWLDLQIISAQPPANNSDTAFVEFVARYRIGGASARRMQERSQFVRIDGNWLYWDGVVRDGLG